MKNYDERWRTLQGYLELVHLSDCAVAITVAIAVAIAVAVARSRCVSILLIS